MAVEVTPLLVKVGVEDFGSPAPVPVTEAKAVRYNPDRVRENMRGLLAIWLIGIMAATIVGSFLLLWIHPDRSKELHELLALVFGPLVALVGAATGYYFGSQSANRS